MFQLRELNIYSILLRIIMAMVVGGIVGIERGRKGRPAGFRTYMLVCMGAAVVMMTNQYISQQFKIDDVSRMGAQVISGIGFLGAGTIIITKKNQVKGLTTAAALWASACIGLAIGIGYYELAIIASIAIFLIMTLLHRFDLSFLKKNALIEIYAELKEDCQLGDFLNFIRASELQIQDVQMIKNSVSGESSISAVILLKDPKKRDHSQIIQKLSEAPSAKYLEEL